MRSLMPSLTAQAAFTEFSGMKATSGLPFAPKIQTFSTQVAAQKSTVRLFWGEPQKPLYASTVSMWLKFSQLFFSRPIELKLC